MSLHIVPIVLVFSDPYLFFWDDWYFLLNARHYVWKAVVITWASGWLYLLPERIYVCCLKAGRIEQSTEVESEMRLIKSWSSDFFKNWSISSSLPAEYNPAGESHRKLEVLIRAPLFWWALTSKFWPSPHQASLKKHLEALLNFFVHVECQVHHFSPLQTPSVAL